MHGIPHVGPGNIWQPQYMSDHLRSRCDRSPGCEAKLRLFSKGSFIHPGLSGDTIELFATLRDIKIKGTFAYIRLPNVGNLLGMSFHTPHNF